MDNLFLETDFSLFTQYQGKTQSEAPEGQKRLQAVYDKLGVILDELKKLGYHTEITRNPLVQGGPSTFKYCSYHWSKVYPKDKQLFDECYNKAFVVVGTTEEGIDIHFDSNSRQGFSSDQNKTTKDIKDNTWLQIYPQEASTLSCSQIVEKIVKFFNTK